MTPTINVKPGKSGKAHPEQLEYLKELCSNYLKSQIPEGNIVLESDFSRYIPLFNKEQNDALGKEAVTELATEYRGRFSLQHAIKIISAEVVDQPSEDAAFYAQDKKYHRVVLELPPMFRPLKTLNELGPRVPTLIDALMTTTARKDNLALGGVDYCKEVERAVALVNPESDKEKFIQHVKDTERKFNEARSEVRDAEVAPVVSDNKSQDDAILTDDLPFVW